MTYAIDFAPHFPMVYLWLAAGVAAVLSILGFILRARGAWIRLIAFALLLAAIANPLIVHETREPLPDIVALVVDHSPSMDIRGRRAQADKAAAAIRATLASDK